MKIETNEYVIICELRQNLICKLRCFFVNFALKFTNSTQNFNKITQNKTQKGQK